MVEFVFLFLVFLFVLLFIFNLYMEKQKVALCHNSKIDFKQC